MSFPSWLSSMFQPRRRTIRKATPRRRTRLSVEMLEGRETPTATLFVNGTAAGLNNGASWANAYTDLHTALAAATAGDQIWVAKGTYSAATSSGGSFSLPSNVEIYGGFAGNETALSQRSVTGLTAVNDSGSLTEDTATVAGNVLTNDFTTNNQTILYGANNTAVVTDSSDGPGTRLDGFTIQGGRYNGSGIYGGTGWRNNGGSPTISNVTIFDNDGDSSYATDGNGGGGGMTNVGGSPTLTNVIFSGNRGERGGGAMWNNHSSPFMTNVVFYNNWANFGAGGGMVNYYDSFPTLMNATFAAGGRSVYTPGTAIANYDTSSATVTNSIVWDGPGDIYDYGTGVSTVRNSDVYNGFSGTGNINVDPLFVGGGDLHLRAGSPARGAGTSVGAPTTDLDGNPRPVGGPIDMGAYQYTVGTGGSPTPVVAAGYTGGSIAGTYGTLNLASNGSYTYTLNSASVQFLNNGQQVQDVFPYQRIGQNGSLSNIASLTISITGLNEPNAAPAVAVHAPASITVYEGSPATISGTWSDADAGNSVTLSASIGTVQKAGMNAAGTWSWSYTPTEEAATQTVTITANDGTVSTQTTFSLTVNDAPLTAGALTPPTGTGTPIVSTFAADSTFHSPVGLAFDAVGNLYVANDNRGGYDGAPQMSMVSPTGQVSAFGPVGGLSFPELITIDPTGNLYVASAGSNSVKKVTPQGVVSTLPYSFYTPHGVVLDALGNLYVSNDADYVNGAGTVVKVTPLGQITTLLTGLYSPGGLAFDTAGNLYVADTGHNRVLELPTTSAGTFGAAINFGSGYVGPYGLAFDAAGNLYVSNTNSGTISAVTPTGTVSTYATGLSFPSGLAFDAAGNLFVANTYPVNSLYNTISKITPPPPVEGQAFTNKTVFHFTDANPFATASDYTAVVTLGDGNTVTLTSTASANGQIVAHACLPYGGFDVQLSYTYAHAIASAVFAVTVTDVGGASTGASLGAAISLPAGAITLDAKVLALANNTVVTTWGGQAAGGTPTYLKGQTPNGSPAVQFNAGGDRMGDNVPVPASAAGDWILVAVVKPNNIGAYQNLADDDPASRPMLWIDSSNRYELNFAGGNGARTAGTGTGGWDIVITDSKNNQLYVNSPTPNATGGGAMTYSLTKNYDFFHRDGGQTFQGLVAEEHIYTNRADFGSDFTALYNSLRAKWIQTFSVADAPLTAGTVNASGGVAGLTPTSLIATFTEANHGAPTSDFSGTIAWGDGSTTPFTSSAVTGSDGSYAVTGSHQYATAGNFSISVTINDVGGQSTIDTGSTSVASAASFTTTIGAGPFTYDGTLHAGGAGTVTGAGGLNTAATSVTYSANPDGTGAADRVNAGTYYVTAHYAGDDNHLPSDGAAVAITIDKATSSTTVSIVGGPFKYNGSAQTPATVSVTGAGGLSLTPAAIYGDNTSAGTASASYSFAGDANHEASSDSKNFDIAKATSVTTVTVNGGPFTYNGSAQTPATVSVTGAGGLNLTPAAIHANNTNAGTATASYSFAGDANHEASSDSRNFDIAKANATVVVTPYTATQLDVAQTSWNYALGFAAGNVYQTFTATKSGSLTRLVLFQNGYYSGTSTIRIRQGSGLAGAVLGTATANWSVTGERSIVFSTPATVQAGSVYTIDLSNGIPDGATTSNAMSVLLQTGNAYSGGFLINQPWTGSAVDQGYDLYFKTFVQSAGVTYDGAAHSATVTSITGVNGETGATVGAVTLNTTHTNAGTYNDSWSFTGAANYNNIASTAITNIINKATPTVTVNAPGGNYNGSAYAATGSVTGVNNTNLGMPMFLYYLASDTAFASPLPGTPKDPGSYVVVASYAGSANYTSASATKSFAILSAQDQANNLKTLIITSLVNSGVLKDGNGNALTTKLDNATASFNSRNVNAGVGQMNAFINQVNAFLNSGKLTTAQAQVLINAANAIIASALAGP